MVAGHFGLTGIRERAGLIGAEVILRSVLGEGTTLQVVVPLNKDPRAGEATAVKARAGKRQL